jgi:hypothetical protein
MQKKHTTCIETTGHGELLVNMQSWLCGPECPKTPGQAAYEELRRQINDSTPIHPWDRLTDKGKAGWERIAEAAIEHYEDPEGLGPIARDMEPEELARFRMSQLPDFNGTLKGVRE